MFCQFLVFCGGSERSVSIFLSSMRFRVEFLTKKLESYSGTRPFRNLYMVVAVSLVCNNITYNRPIQIVDCVFTKAVKITKKNRIAIEYFLSRPDFQA